MQQGRTASPAWGLADQQYESQSLHSVRNSQSMPNRAWLYDKAPLHRSPRGAAASASVRPLPTSAISRWPPPPPLRKEQSRGQRGVGALEHEARARGKGGVGQPCASADTLLSA